MGRRLRTGRPERPLRPDARLCLPVALPAHALEAEIRPPDGIRPARRIDGGVLLRRLLQHDLRRIRQRSAARRHDRAGLLGRQLRPAALRAAAATAVVEGMAGRAARDLRRRDPLQRRQRILFLERIRRALQLHRRGLSGLHERGGGQHHGVLPDRPAGDADRRADRRRHVVALPPRHPRRRGVQNRQVETRRLADLSGHGGRRPVDAALQHAVPDERQRILQRIAGQRTL